MRRIAWGMGAVCWLQVAVFGVEPSALLNWRYDTYEPETPLLANPLKDAKLTVSGQWSDRGPQFVADGKIEGPKDRFHPKNWARKWVRYANDLPVSRQRYEMVCRELPQFPQDDE